jgi:hypothetical protein
VLVEKYRNRWFPFLQQSRVTDLYHYRRGGEYIAAEVALPVAQIIEQEIDHYRLYRAAWGSVGRPFVPGAKEASEMPDAPTAEFIAIASVTARRRSRALIASVKDIPDLGTQALFL